MPKSANAVKPNTVTPGKLVLNKDSNGDLSGIDKSVVYKAGIYKSGIYKIDTPHSKVGFEITHLMISTVVGSFDTFDGEVEIGNALKDLKLHATLDAASINTNDKKRDTELRGPQFFDVTKFPRIVFISRTVSGTPDHLIIKGDLSIRGITQAILLDGKLRGTVNDSFGNTKVAISANGKISRKAFGLLWNKTIETGPVLSDEVTLDIRVEAARRN